MHADPVQVRADLVGDAARLGVGIGHEQRLAAPELAQAVDRARR